MSHEEHHDPHENEHHHHEDESDHQDHHDHGDDFHEPAEEWEEELPIESAGVVNDLSIGLLDEEVDVTGFFEFSEVAAFSPTQSEPWTDLVPGGSMPELDFSERLVLKLAQSRENSPFLDLYSEGVAYVPFWELSKTGRTVKVPRMRMISLSDPLPETPENTIDIRDGEVHQPGMLYPDVYLLPLDFSRRVRHIRKRHGRKIAKALAWAAVWGVACTLTLVSLAYLTKERVMSGYVALSGISLTQTDSELGERIQSIRSDFHSANRYFAPIRFCIAFGLIDNETARNALHALDGGLAVSDILEQLDSMRSEYRPDIRMTDYYQANTEAFSSLAQNISKARYNFSSITTTGDDHRDAQLHKVSEIFKSVETLISYMKDHEKEILSILGDRKPMNYLILNQNRDELRANGGFPWSAVEVTLYKGKIEKYEKRDIYFYDWHLFPYGETPPPGIDQITQVYGMRDANYYPDFRQTFETMSRMYEKAGGSSLDGMIAINQWIVEDILSIIGPVKVPWVRDPVTAESFSLLLSVLVEWQVSRETSAKDILFRTIEEIEKKTMEAKKFDLYLKAIEKQIHDRQILVALRNPQDHTFAQEIFGGTQYRGNTANFVYPIFTSLGANKSDRYMKRTFELSTLSASWCVFSNRIAISAEHSFSVTERERIRRMLYEYGIDPAQHEHELFVQWNGDNVQYVRILVPKGASIIWASPEIQTMLKLDSSDSEYDSFAFNMTVRVGEMKKTWIDYTSSPKDCRPEFDFIVQPGLRNYTLSLIWKN